MEYHIVNAEDKYPIAKCIPLSIQHLLGMFGSSMLVPLLFKIDPALVLLFDGVGILVYVIATRFKVPAVMGSSFSYIAPVILISSIYGYESACGAFVVCGMLLAIFGMIISKIGTKWISKLLPPISSRCDNHGYRSAAFA